MIFRAGSEKGGCFETLRRCSFLLIIREIRFLRSRHVATKDDVKMQDTDQMMCWTLNDFPGLVNDIYFHQPPPLAGETPLLAQGHLIRFPLHVSWTSSEHFVQYGSGSIRERGDTDR
jgi:hypothetical protein